MANSTKKAVVISGPAQEMILRRDVDVEIQNPLSALRDPKLAKARTQILADINNDIAKTWRERRSPGDPPKLAASDLAFEVIVDRKR